MSKDTAIIVLGFFVALLPFLGFPRSWETVFFIIVGLGVVILAFLWRKDVLQGELTNGVRKEKKTDAYVENGVGHSESPHQQPRKISPKV